MKKENEFTRNIEKGLMEVTAYQFNAYNIEPSFPEEIARLRAKDLKVQNCSERKNFCREKVLIIDGEDCKDMETRIPGKKQQCDTLFVVARIVPREIGLCVTQFGTAKKTHFIKEKNHEEGERIH